MSEAKAYADLATILSLISTFAGSITFTSFLSLPCTDALIRTLLAYASILFLASILSAVPIYVAVHRSGTDNVISRGSRWFVVRQFIAVAGLMSAAFVLLYVVLYFYGQAGPMALGVAILGANVLLSLGALTIERGRRSDGGGSGAQVAAGEANVGGRARTVQTDDINAICPVQPSQSRTAAHSADNSALEKNARRLQEAPPRPRARLINHFILVRLRHFVAFVVLAALVPIIAAVVGRFVKPVNRCA